MRKVCCPAHQLAFGVELECALPRLEIIAEFIAFCCQKHRFDVDHLSNLISERKNQCSDSQWQSKIDNPNKKMYDVSNIVQIIAQFRVFFNCWCFYVVFCRLRKQKPRNITLPSLSDVRLVFVFRVKHRTCFHCLILSEFHFFC